MVTNYCTRCFPACSQDNFVLKLSEPSFFLLNHDQNDHSVRSVKIAFKSVKSQGFFSGGWQPFQNFVFFVLMEIDVLLFFYI